MKRTPFPRPKPREDGRNSTFPIPKPAPGQYNNTMARVKRNKTAAEKTRDKLYLVAKKEYFTLHPMCEFPGCCRKAIDIHHARGRTGELLYDKRWFVATCREHHDRCEQAHGEDLEKFKEMEWKVTRHRNGEVDQEQEESE